MTRKNLRKQVAQLEFRPQHNNASAEETEQFLKYQRAASRKLDCRPRDCLGLEFSRYAVMCPDRQFRISLCYSVRFRQVEKGVVQQHRPYRQFTAGGRCSDIVFGLPSTKLPNVLSYRGLRLEQSLLPTFPKLVCKEPMLEFECRTILHEGHFRPYVTGSRPTRSGSPDRKVALGLALLVAVMCRQE